MGQMPQEEGPRTGYLPPNGATGAASPMPGSNRPAAVLGAPVSGAPAYRTNGSSYVVIQDKNGEKKNGNGNGNGDDKKDDEEKKDEGPWRLIPNEIHGFKITGWVYGTGNYNATNSGDTRYNGPMTTNDQEGVYLNQLWLNVNRPLKECFGWGANFDFVFGNDYLSSESRGFENERARGWLPQWNGNQDYGIAIPQAYVELGTTKASLKLGHFYTPHGYMVVQAPGNFFNTLPNSFMWANPFVHWGGMATASVSDELTVNFGIVNGWDALDRPVNSPAYMFGAKYLLKECDKDKGFLSVNIITGQEPENIGPAYANRLLITTILDYKFTEKLEFVFEQNTGWQENRNGLGTSCFYSFDPYLFYKINDCLKVGLRYDYFRDPGNFAAAERVGNPNNGPIPANVVAGPYTGDFQTVAFGLNWAPHGSKNLMIRPEIRYDWFNGTGVNGGPYNAGQSNNQFMVVVGAFYLF